MAMRELDWRGGNEQVDESVVRELEEHLGVRFPTDYRDFVRRHSGGRPKQTDFRIPDSRKRVVGVGVFLKAKLDPGEDYSIAQARDWLEDLPSEVVPISEGAGGDYVCLDYRSAGAPRIVYWHHERVGDSDEFTPVSSSFTEFLDLLFEPDLEREPKS